MTTDFLDKLCTRGELAQRLARLARPVVFTNGVFDILHRGHVTYLAQARAQGASLVVGLNSDASARSLGKGPDRPLNAQLDRACVLAALEKMKEIIDQRFPLRCPGPTSAPEEAAAFFGDVDVVAAECQTLGRGVGGHLPGHSRDTEKP